MSTLEDTAAGKTKDPEADEGLTSTLPIQAASALRTSTLSLEDEASLPFLKSDPSLFIDGDSESESGNESYTTSEDTSTLQLPIELNGDEDLIDVSRHHGKLRNLHALIYKNSIFAILKRGDLLVRHPSYDSRPQSIRPSEIRRIANAISDRNDKSTQTQAYRYIECYNILRRICDNLRLLQQMNFCCANISLLCVTDIRRGVAELLRVEVCEVVDLCSNMKKNLEKFFEFSEDTNLLDEFYLSPRVLHSLTEMCTLEQYRAATSGRDVPPKNPNQDELPNPPDPPVPTSQAVSPNPPDTPVPASRYASPNPPDTPVPASRSVSPNPPDTPVPASRYVSPNPPDTPVPTSQAVSPNPPDTPVPTSRSVSPNPPDTPVPTYTPVPTSRAVSPVSYGQKDLEGHKMESFVRPGTKSLISTSPRTSHPPTTAPILPSPMERSIKETIQEEFGTEVLLKPPSAIQRDQFTKNESKSEKGAEKLSLLEEASQAKVPLILRLFLALDIALQNLTSRFPLRNGVYQGSRVYTILRSLDLMIISYAGAHTLEPMLPGEQQDWRNLHINGRSISYGANIQAHKGTVILTRRKSKCLDGFFGGQKLWVFHNNINLNDRQSLHISASPEEFADIWGPMWKISKSRDSDAALRYDLEKGSIVPSQTPPVGWDIRLFHNELPCHWVSNHNLRVWKTDNASQEPPLILKDQRLVIGGSHQIRLIENTNLCLCDSARLKTDLSNSGYLRTPGTSKARRKTDAETFSAMVGSGSPGVAFGYSRSTKIIAGRSWKESLLKRWIHERTTRNPYTLLHYRGIEISHCTSHSRRIRLVDILGTKTMTKWFSITTPVKIPEAAVRIDQMLKSCPTQLVECYINEPAMRENIGDLVGACLDVLFETGCTAESAMALSAFWTFANDEYVIEYPPKRFGWSGLIQDTDSSCAFVVLEENCLIFCLGRKCQYPSRNSQMLDQFGSLFETRLIINDKMKLPEGLVLRRRSKPARWSVRHVEKGTFRIGDHGSLKVSKPMSDHHLLLRWSNEFSLISSCRGLAARVLSSEPAKFHREYISADAERKLAPVHIFVAS